MKGWIIGVGALAVVGIVLGIYASANNKASRMEENLQAKWDNSQSVLANYGQKVQEAAQVPDMYKDDLVKVATAALQGRYGAEGSKAVFQSIQEHNPNVDSKLYSKLQTIIEAGRNDFQKSQKEVIDAKQAYQVALRSFPGGTMMKMIGFPEMDLNAIKIVTTERASNAFESGRESAPVKLR